MKWDIFTIILKIIHKKDEKSSFCYIGTYFAICRVKAKGGGWMKKVLLASHGDLSQGMLHSVKIIIGTPQCEVETYSLYPGESALDFAIKYKEKALLDPENQYVIIADVLGGSVHTAFTQILDVKNISLFSGMNMGMVLEMLTTNEFDQEDGPAFVETGQSGISFMSENSELMEEEEDF